MSFAFPTWHCVTSRTWIRRSSLSCASNIRLPARLAGALAQARAAALEELETELAVGAVADKPKEPAVVLAAAPEAIPKLRDHAKAAVTKPFSGRYILTIHSSL